MASDAGVDDEVSVGLLVHPERHEGNGGQRPCLKAKADAEVEPAASEDTDRSATDAEQPKRHDQERQRVVAPRDGEVATDDGRPVYRYSTDSPLRTTEGALELLPAYAGQVAGQVHRIAPAGELLASIMRDAEASLTRLKNSANSE